MATFGNTGTFTLHQDGIGGGYILGQKFALTENGTITDIRFYHAQPNSPQTVRLAIYDDAIGDSGHAHNHLKCETAELVGNVAAEWTTGAISPGVPLTAGNYWIVALSNQDLNLYYSGSGSNPYYGAQAYGAFPATFIGPSSPLSYANFPIYATYSVAGATNVIYMIFES